MTSRDSLDRAEAALEQGKNSKALRHAWSVVLDAMQQRDLESLRRAQGIGERISNTSTGKEHEAADQLSRYARAAIDGIEDGVEQVSWWQRLIGRREQSVKKCPDCAEQIQLHARVCRHCGYRYDLSAP